MRHVARVVHTFKPHGFGDPFYSHETSIRQAQRGNYVTVFTWNKASAAPVENVTPNFSIVRLPGINLAVKGLFTDYPYLPTLSKALATEKFDIIHCHSHLFLTTVQAIKKAKDLGLPSIVTVHGVSAVRSLITNYAQRVYLHSFGEYVFRNATKVVCLTQSDAYELTKYGCPSDKIRIIPNAVDADMFSPKRGLEDEKSVVWVGRFVPEKGLHVLVEAARLVERIDPNIGFSLIGEGPEMGNVRQLASAYGLRNMIFAGKRGVKEVAEILAKATVFVFPSIKEGMPKAVLEAMASGKPILASDVTSLREIIQTGSNGLLFPVADPHALADAIILLIQDKKLRKELGEQARNTAVRDYSWENNLSLLDQVYEEAVIES